MLASINNISKVECLPIKETSIKHIDLKHEKLSGDNVFLTDTAKFIQQNLQKINKFDKSLNLQPTKSINNSINKTILSSLITAGVFANAPKDKLLHAVACAAISTGTAEVTGNPAIGFMVSADIGIGKEMIDGSSLNPKGSRDLKDLAADLKGACIGLAVSSAFWLYEYYLKQKQIKKIPNEIALSSYLAQNNKKFEFLLNNYPAKGALINLANQLKDKKEADNNIALEFNKQTKLFNSYLIINLKDELKAEKKRIYKTATENKDKLGKIFEIGSTSAMFIRQTAPFVNAAAGIIPKVSPIIRVLGKIAPGLSAVSTVKIAYDTVKDYQNPKLPQKVKAYSIGQLVFSGIGLASFFIPVIGLPLAVASISGSIALSIAKAKAMKTVGKVSVSDA